MPTTTPPGLRGPAHPAIGTPPLAEGATRRATALLASWPEGFEGPRHVEGRGLELGPGARSIPVGLEVRVDADGTIESFEVWRASGAGVERAACPELVGIPVTRGFRALAREVLADDWRLGSPLRTLADDLPAIVSVSGYGRLRNGYDPPPIRLSPARRADICAGWRADGSLVRRLESDATLMVTPGPVVPALLDAALDHRPLTVRRHRRLDVAEDGTLRIDAFFRDSYCDPEGTEWVIHEYSVDAGADRATTVVGHLAVALGVLPYAECPAALASAQHLVGRPLDGLRDTLKGDLVGASTCTHLTDMLRSLEDALALVAMPAGLPEDQGADPGR